MSSRPVLATLVAAGLSAVVALPAHATPSVSSVRAGSSTNSAARASVATQTRPAPKPFRDSLLRAARRGVGGATHLRPAAGVRPIGSGVSSDLPTRIEIGGRVLLTSYTVNTSPSTASYAKPAVLIGLADAQGNLVVTTFVVGTRGQTTFSGAVAIPDQAVGALGTGQWVVVYGEADTNSDNLPTAALATTIKLRSLLAEKLSRRGEYVDVFGAAKTYSEQSDSYLPRFGQPITVQRWAGNGWVNLTTVRTDSRGHIATRLHIPWRVGIRLVTPDTPLVFGAASASASI